jgi:uncharacterized protein YjiK
MLKNIPFSRLYFIPLFIVLSCHLGADHKAADLPYDLNHPSKNLSLPPLLNEISGISFAPEENSIYAIEDEDGNLYKFTINDVSKIEKWNFGKKGDYEDLVYQDHYFYVLKSNGNIHKFNLESGEVRNETTFNFPEKGNNEFETLYYDDQGKRLIMICKDCKGEKKTSLHAWAVNMQTGEYTPGVFQNTAEGKQALKPSAAAINPKTNELYILSSVNKLLIIADKNGKISNSYPLNEKLFKQPEGITFLPDGDMLISNERNNGDSGQLLVFHFKGLNKTQ